MSSWLRGKRNEPTPEVRPEVIGLLPPSVRQPEVRGFTPSDDSTPYDADDADLEFLTALASEVDRKAAPSGAQTPTPLRGASPRIDDMHVFREMKDEGDKTVRFDHQVGDVDMGDLLEELSTVRAALRRRRAA